jgi:hypothetical protein
MGDTSLWKAVTRSKPAARQKVAAPKKKVVPRPMKAPAPRKPEPVSLTPLFCGEEVNLDDRTRIFDLHEILVKQGILTSGEYEILKAALRDKITAVLEGERRGV